MDKLQDNFKNKIYMHFYSHLKRNSLNINRRLFLVISTTYFCVRAAIWQIIEQIIYFLFCIFNNAKTPSKLIRPGFLLRKIYPNNKGIYVSSKCNYILFLTRNLPKLFNILLVFIKNTFKNWDCSFVMKFSNRFPFRTSVGLPFFPYYIFTYELW